VLTNVLRLLGHIVRNKNDRKINTRPTQVILPLSPNHGAFGGDGMYSESKLGLEGLLDRFHSETWSESLLICGAVIGWTRGTGLMGGNDLVAQAVESHNVMTFSQKEMAFNLLALMTAPVIEMCETEPIWADLNGGLHLLPNVKQILTETRAQLNQTSKIRMALAREDLRQEVVLKGPAAAARLDDEGTSKPRSTLQVGYPELPDFEREVMPLQHMKGMVDPSSVPVIVGFSELGPWGSSRTRWEIESRGVFSQEGYIEMAWMMNLIKHFDGEDKGEHYAGWVDAKTGERVQDSEIGQRYCQSILEHSGVRLVEPELCDGYDPGRKEYMHEIAIEEDLPEFTASRETAEAFKLRHGANAAIRQAGESDEFKVQIKRGASVMISKAIPFEGFVAGQIPSGWDPTKYGISKDIIEQVDPVTQYALCCASEALYSAGIIDAYEMLQHLHISEIGNFIGSMMGGVTKTRQMYKDRYLDKDVQGDVMQETYLSTTAAWINMLLLGTAGPIKTPTGACATGIESIDSACESLITGKTKLCFVGGTDDFEESESFAFRTMNATVNAREELAKGRLPSEMSRPTSSTRAGFVEAQGSGVQIITTAELALKLGLPIYGIIGASTMASDKIGRSVPAPGQGVLSFARETPEASVSPLLDLDFRRDGMNSAIEGVNRWRDTSLQKAYLGGNWSMATPSPLSDVSEDSVAETLVQLPDSLSAAISHINNAANSQIKQARKLWGNQFRKQDPDISPLRAALAAWGLTVDDIDIASLHATSTKANDKNEPSILNQEMIHLGRSEGHPMLAICQKSVTGHPKAPAAAFMLNGCLQAMNTGLVPGNRNADNVDALLSEFRHIVFPTRPVQTRQLKAFSLTSFGFGQKGGQIIGVHPRYLYATLDYAAYTSYCTRVASRTGAANRAYQRALFTNSIVQCKDKPPYAAADESRVLMDPRARAVEDMAESTVAEPAATSTWKFDLHRLHPETVEPEREDLTLCNTPPLGKGSSGGIVDMVSASKSWLEAAAAVGDSSQARVSVGIDVEEVDGFKECHEVFIERNYTGKEKEWARRSVDSQSAFAGRWSAKEAVFKSLGVKGKGGGAALKEIEIVSTGGSPIVKVSR
jgi:fatty acid synthase subunit alpha, fungi type